MSDRSRPGRDQAHLVVAAVRVLRHRSGRLPAVEEIAELLDRAPEAIGVAVRQLVDLGALREIRDAYGSFFEIAEYTRLEELPEGEGAAMSSELLDFSEKKREKDEALKEQFAGDLDARRKQKFSKLEEELKRFRGGSGRKTNLWGEPVEESPEDE